MIIDIHMHPYCKEATVLPTLQEGIRRMLGTSGQGNPMSDQVSEMMTYWFTKRSITDIINAMDDAGVDKACIVAMDMTTHYGVEVVTNEDTVKLASAHPDRFIPFASVDPTMGRAAVDKLRHAINNLGCKALKLVPPVQHFDFSDPKHNPLWEAALELDILIWTHCAHQMSKPDSDARLGHPMLIEPVARKYPRLKIVLGHVGVPWIWEAWSVVIRNPNVYLDISAYPDFYKHIPWEAYSRYGAEHKILFATDYPFTDIKETLVALDAVDISTEFKKKILSENAARLLNIDENILLSS
ncbi:MAG: hypothetical protein A2169_02160 [Deltaproteobacteria bacterium RBG_13_47_9]|nr:MAG: hypothetical protein A2169_02160 [Deltaproteobacteria bacterium RBG_13_47_9]